MTIRNHAATVDLSPDIYPLPAVAAHLGKAEHWERMALESRRAAEQEIKDAEAVALGLENPTPAALSAFVDVIEKNRRWWDEQALNVEAGPPGWDPPAVLAARKLARAERWRGGQLLTMATVGLYAAFAKQAAAAVARVAGVLPLPARAWPAGDPTAVLPADVLSVLQESERVMNVCHFAGLYLRSMGLQGADQLLGDEPPLALTFKRWAEAHAHHHELRTIRRPLKLAYVI